VGKKSVGILMYHCRNGAPEVLLVHPGGPLWKNKDKGSWSIPKGEIKEGEDLLETARREFHEETGCDITGQPVPLTALRQASGKLVHAWALEGDCEAAAIKSNLFTMEWPPRSGKQETFPEVDRAGWFTLPAAREKILPGQRGFIDQLEKVLAGPLPGEQAGAHTRKCSGTA